MHNTRRAELDEYLVNVLTTAVENLDDSRAGHIVLWHDLRRFLGLLETEQEEGGGGGGGGLGGGDSPVPEEDEFDSVEEEDRGQPTARTRSDGGGGAGGAGGGGGGGGVAVGSAVGGRSVSASGISSGGPGPLGRRPQMRQSAGASEWAQAGEQRRLEEAENLSQVAYR